MKKIILAESSYTAWIMDWVVKEAKRSTCKRSKCGSIIVDLSDHIIGSGHNSMPAGECGECFKDNLPEGFKSDKTCCVHAEQRAIMDALGRSPKELKDSFLFFIRLDENNNPKYSGEPYCTICSKMALDVGITRFCLWREDGWTCYETKFYNVLSFSYHQGRNK